MRKGYSVPQDFSWIENDKLKSWFLLAMTICTPVGKNNINKRK